mmetsp:Transcript_50733/g.99766  ORF Transcript_50733/g.99766 Transcript_50733/m.99766 type:complete len:82 (-) Transcript_50733:1933-2178(-)
MHGWKKTLLPNRIAMHLFTNNSCAKQEFNAQKRIWAPYTSCSKENGSHSNYTRGKRWRAKQPLDSSLPPLSFSYEETRQMT